MDNTPNTNLVEYIYASAATQEFSGDDLIHLLRLARTNNTQLDITGMLLHHDGSFIQVLEGPEEAVRTLFETISRDERHANILLLSKRAIEERSFGNWGMGFVCTSCLGMKDLEGFSDLLLSQATALEMEHHADRAHQVLLKFREGRYHQHVDQDASLRQPA
jgi:hypothetical protein